MKKKRVTFDLPEDDEPVYTSGVNEARYKDELEDWVASFEKNGYGDLEMEMVINPELHKQSHAGKERKRRAAHQQGCCSLV
ncbi:MAG: hypothetical protein ACHP6I_00275 [Rickettsiales bacterium]